MMRPESKCLAKIAFSAFLEELLEQPRTLPEEVCANDPDLLPEVRCGGRYSSWRINSMSCPGSDSTTSGIPASES